MTTTTIPAARLDMANQVRRLCRAEIGRSTSAAWIASMRRILSVPTETLASWTQPNESTWTNVNLALSMSNQVTR
jgi:hypothetical protein